MARPSPSLTPRVPEPYVPTFLEDYFEETTFEGKASLEKLRLMRILTFYIDSQRHWPETKFIFPGANNINFLLPVNN